jgi:polysaccharide pyruvyl transferase WcaK-like protein
VPGTGALDDFGWSPFGYPHDMLVWAFAARVQRANLFLVSIGAGPVRHPLSRIFFKLIAKNAVYRSFRDQESKDFANSIGIRSSRDYVFPDIVFSKEPPTSVDGIKHSQQGIGIGVMTYYGWSADQQKGKDIYSNYLIKLCAFVSWLIENGYNIRLLLGEQTDHSSIAAIQNNVRSIIKPIDNHRIKYNAIHNFSDLLHEISTTQIVVASRFHNVVASLMCGRPTISLGYSSKNTAIMKDFGLGEFCQNIEDFDIDILKAHFNKLIVAKHDISQKLIAKTKVLRTQLTLQERLLEKRIFEAGNI